MNNSVDLPRHVRFTSRARHMTVVTLTALALAAGTATPAAAAPVATAPSVAPAIPAATTKTTVTYTTTANLNLRSGASTKHRSVAVLKKGTKLALRATKGTWHKVTANGRTGWVAKTYVKKTTTKTVSAPPVTSATTAKNVKYTTTTALLLRKSAPSGSVVVTMKKGSVVTTTGAARKVSGKTWYQVRFGTRTGWASSAYLKKVAASPSTPPVTSGAPGKFTTTANVNLRASAPSGKVLALVAKGTGVSATGKTTKIGSTTWRQIKAGATTGWASGAYLGAYVAPPATSVPSPTDPPAAVPASFTIAGAGWGHGVGMSQYGAQGMAKSGLGAPAILAHYYAPARTATTANHASSEIKVQLLAAATSTITPAGGRLRILDGAKVLATTSAPVSLKVSNGKVVATIGSTSYTAGGPLGVQWEGTRYWSGAATTVSVPKASGGTSLGTYRHGKINVSVLGGRLNLVNQVRMNDEYLYGLAEMPSSWEPAALQAQAIAGRTYAMRNMNSLKAACECNVYDEVASQKFTGWSKENEGGGTSGAKWKAAVNATQVKSSGVPVSATVVQYNGVLIDAVYFSSSGGKTRTAQSVWGTNHDYLQSRADPYSVSAASGNPYRAWAYKATQAKVAAAFAVKDVVSVSVTKNNDLTISSATATTATGQKTTITGARFRAALPTLSAWVGSVTAG